MIKQTRWYNKIILIQLHGTFHGLKSKSCSSTSEYWGLTATKKKYCKTISTYKAVLQLNFPNCLQICKYIVFKLIIKMFCKYSNILGSNLSFHHIFIYMKHLKLSNTARPTNKRSLKTLLKKPLERGTKIVDMKLFEKYEKNHRKAIYF